MVSRYCSYLLPRQVDGTFKIQVNWRFSSTRCVTLYSLALKSIRILSLRSTFNSSCLLHRIRVGAQIDTFSQNINYAIAD